MSESYKIIEENCFSGDLTVKVSNFFHYLTDKAPIETLKGFCEINLHNSTRFYTIDPPKNAEKSKSNFKHF